MTTSGIPSAIVAYKYAIDDRRSAITEDRQKIDCLAFWNAIEPHIQGAWDVTKVLEDDTDPDRVPRSIHVQSKDGVRLYILAGGKKYGVETHVTVGMGRYEHEVGPWKGNVMTGHDRSGPTSMSVDVSKRNPASIAKAIQSRLIDPIRTDCLPKIWAKREQGQTYATAQDEALKACSELGLPTRSHFHDANKRFAEIKCGSTTYTLIIDAGRIEMQREITLTAEDLPKLVAFLKSIHRKA